MLMHVTCRKEEHLSLSVLPAQSHKDGDGLQRLSPQGPRPLELRSRACAGRQAQHQRAPGRLAPLVLQRRACCAVGQRAAQRGGLRMHARML